MRLFGAALILVACALYAALRLEVRTAITDFLPHDAQAERLALARELSTSAQSRAVVFTLSAATPEAHRQAAKAFASALRQSGHFEWLRSGLDAHDQEAFYRLFFPARLGLLKLPVGAGPVPDSFLDARFIALRESLASPLSALTKRLAPADPLGAFQGVLDEAAKGRGKVKVVDDQLVSEDGRFALLFGATRAPAFDASAQAKLEAAVNGAFAQLKGADPSLTLEWTGVNRFALAGERSVRGDIERISSLSLLGIFALYFLIFRSPREPLLVLLPIGFGCLVALCVCQAVFGFVHGLTLAFGSSIIGVAEDYSTHFFTHRLSAPESESSETLMRRLWPGMWMGAATTVAGLLALLGSGFPGLSQMALFGAVGVVAALLCTRYVLPSLSRRGATTAEGKLSPLGLRLVSWIKLRKVNAAWFLGPALFCMAVGLPKLHFQDGMSALRTKAPALDAENQRVQARLGRGAAGRLVVSVGANDEEALMRAEQVRTVLANAERQGLVREVRSLTQLLPSMASQRATLQRLRGDPTFIPRFRAAAERQGFAADAFAPFEADLVKPEPPLLSLTQLGQSPLADLVTPFHVVLPGKVVILTPVDTEDGKAVDALLRGLKGSFYLDQQALFDDAYARFRSRALMLVLVGVLFVLATLWLRYRNLTVALLGLLPAVLGAGAALGVGALCGAPATLLHVIAVILILSMGVDYGIYVLESRHDVAEGVVTLGSVLLAALTTVLSFGALGLSDNPGLSGIGITVSLGMLFTVLASPVVLSWTGTDQGA